MAKKSFSPAGQLWFSLAGKNVLNESRIALLEKIEETGSITQAGKTVGISYRTAWITIDHLNSLVDSALVDRTTGGKSGGGTQLTRHGQTLVKMYRTLQTEHAKYIQRLRDGIEDFDRFLHLTRKIALKTSARNQVFGVVESIRKDSLNAIVALQLKGGDKLISQITLAGLESLGLRKGEEAYALIKANWISLENTRQSKRDKATHKKTSNQLIGKIISIQKGKTTAGFTIGIRKSHLPKIQCLRCYFRGCAVSLIISLLSLCILTLPHLSSACASCGCALSSDWGHLGFSTTRGFKFDLKYDYLNQVQLRSGTGSISPKTSSQIINNGDPQEVETYTKNNYLTFGVEYNLSSEMGISLQMPYIYWKKELQRIQP